MSILQSLFIVTLFVCIRAGDIAICAGVARDILRAVLYGVTSILALVIVVLTVVH